MELEEFIFVVMPLPFFVAFAIWNVFIIRRYFTTPIILLSSFNFLFLMFGGYIHLRILQGAYPTYLPHIILFFSGLYLFLAEFVMRNKLSNRVG